MKTKFYTVRQNNSGGYCEENEEDGIGEYIIVEAPNDDYAEDKLRKIVENYSVYCPCCGERWYINTYNDGKDVPMIYDEPVEQYENSWLSGTQTIYIHYMDGRIEKIEKK